MINNNKLYELLSDNKLFIYANKSLFKRIDNIDSIMIYLKKNITNETNPLANNLYMILLLNIYTNFEEDELLFNPEIILDILLQSIQRNINLYQCLKLFKKFVKYIDNDFITKKNYNIISITETLLNVNIINLAVRERYSNCSYG
jgi:hypothetical protein